METKEETKKYSTKSIDSAACLMAKGARIVGVKREKEDDKFLTFLFEGAFDMERVTLDLASKVLEINAYELLESARRLKSIVHSTPR